MSIKTFLTSNKKRTGIIISLIILFSGIIPLVIFTYFADTDHPYTISPVNLTSEDGTEIDALLYNPLTATGNIPGVVLAHGYCGSKGNLQKLAIELVKRNYLIINIDFRGHGTSGGLLPEGPERYEKLEMDVMAAVNYLQNTGRVNQIGLVGHSMGGATVNGFAVKNSEIINATVSIGMIPSLENVSLIKNLLIAVGQYEQIFPQELAKDVLKEYTGLSNVELNTQYGSFSEYNATKIITGPFSEHLYERHDPVILYGIVEWFEYSFYGSIRWEINITSVYHAIGYYISVFGAVCLSFVIIIYLRNYIFKGKEEKQRKNVVKNSSLLRLIMGYIIVGVIGFLSFILFSNVFTDVLPVSSGNSLFAFYFGMTVGILLVYYLLILRNEGLSISDYPEKIKELTSENYLRSMILGSAAAVLLIISISSVTHWSEMPLFPTIREIGTMIGLVLFFFPILFVKEFYFRTVQGELNFTNRFKEYFSMVGIGVFLDNVVLIPVMILTWGSPNHEIGFIALSLTVMFAMFLIMQILVTWVYIHSGRNIAGSTVFLCIFYSWMIINFFPFA